MGCPSTENVPWKAAAISASLRSVTIDVVEWDCKPLCLAAPVKGHAKRVKGHAQHVRISPLLSAGQGEVTAEEK